MYSERDHRSNVQQMLESDRFSRWLGVRLVALGEGSCTLSMVVTEEMANGFGIAHGGIVFSLADSAMAFASNPGPDVRVSISSSINYSARSEIGDVLTAAATRVAGSGRMATFDVTVKRNPEIPVAVFRGTVYRTKLADDE